MTTTNRREKRESALLKQMTIADDIMTELRQNPGLTVMAITVNIFGRRHPYNWKVNDECRRLVEAGRLERRGNGRQGDPFTYYLLR
jgi:hypothetical protein